MKSLAMIDPEKGKSTLEDASSVSYSMYFLVLVFNSVIFTWSSIALYISFTTRSGTSVNMERSLRERYPGYFRFASEQYAFENLPRKIVPAPSFPHIPGSKSISQFQRKESVFTKDVTVYHACCQSNDSYISPDYWVDVVGINRTMAVFTDPVTQKEARQYFYTERCSGRTSCLYRCNCTQETYLVTGIYVTGTKYGISWFPLLGNCKCRNF